MLLGFYQRHRVPLGRLCGAVLIRVLCCDLSFAIFLKWILVRMLRCSLCTLLWIAKGCCLL